ncbi:hypothetical protein H5410_000878 [Solanum commersonii]|uniref:Uncharacterized protein n=1 Tax=Solanum commersonii TaxID=4109 RepID=A0A9J6AXP9_SOLCO|nr:hypothetical protein H5410_000878 [Solanum commersonii]
MGLNAAKRAWFKGFKSLFTKELSMVKFDILPKQLCDDLTNYGLTNDEPVEVGAMEKKSLLPIKVRYTNIEDGSVVKDGSSSSEAKLRSPRKAQNDSATEFDRELRLYPPSKKNTQRPPHKSFASCLMLEASIINTSLKVGNGHKNFLLGRQLIRTWFTQTISNPPLFYSPFSIFGE